MTDLDEDRLTAIRRREQEAHPRPWKAETYRQDLLGFRRPVSGGRILRIDTDRRGEERELLVTDHVHSADDAEFMAEAREDIPWLLDVVDQLRAANAELAGEITRLRVQNAALATIKDGRHEIIITEDGEAGVILHHPGHVEQGTWTEPPSAEFCGTVGQLIQYAETMQAKVRTVRTAFEPSEDENSPIWELVRTHTMSAEAAKIESEIRRMVLDPLLADSSPTPTTTPVAETTRSAR